MEDKDNSTNRADEIISMQERGRSSWLETFAGVVLFLLMSAFLIMEEIPVDWIAPEKIPLRFVLIWIIVLLPPAGIALGWMRSFPRWSFAYLGAALFSYYLASNYRPYHSVAGRELVGNFACIPVLLALGIGILVTRSIQPLSILVNRVYRDLTLITYAMFGVMPFLAWVSFDEIDRLYSLRWMVLLALVMAFTAFFYLRSHTQKQRVAALSAGILLSIISMVVGPALYQPGWMDLEPTITIAVFIVAIMLAPALASLANWAADTGGVS